MSNKESGFRLNMQRKMVEYFTKHPKKTVYDYALTSHVQTEVIRELCEMLVKEGILPSTVLGDKG